ncbi:unnamed protein product [Enterobius vermicularis]|uniref:SH2 domain-containing protein n=1 Tax=Enterobius vermicularis TaxID=51028 RepID=A0A0N4V799_ENTVE|nr:unnamed protein product [Enterobius vermicularis]
MPVGRAGEIQDLYEDTLLDERKSITQKTVETRRLVDLWEKDPPLGRPKDAPLAAADSGFRYVEQPHQASSYMNGYDPSLSSYSYRSEQRREYVSVFQDYIIFLHRPAAARAHYNHFGSTLILRGQKQVTVVTGVWSV